jgi:hypothetical protein
MSIWLSTRGPIDLGLLDEGLIILDAFGIFGCNNMKIGGAYCGLESPILWGGTHNTMYKLTWV